MMPLNSLFKDSLKIDGNMIQLLSKSEHKNQQQTIDVFTDKWNQVEQDETKLKAWAFQREWYLKLYGFSDDATLRGFLRGKPIILDAGCGLGYKAAWFAELSPNSLVIGMDFSDSVRYAAKNYSHLKNLYFIQGDIANTSLKEGMIDFVNCDQVIMHTEKPEETFRHLSSLLAKEGEFACYVYAKKALPRELLDDYFRQEVHALGSKSLWEMSKQLTELGKNLSELNIKFQCPEIPLLGIKGGEYDVQRFIYWNFLKCFWNDDLGFDISVATNFDWYSPSNAKRYSEEEFLKMVVNNKLRTVSFYKEEACLLWQI